MTYQFRFSQEGSPSVLVEKASRCIRRARRLAQAVVADRIARGDIAPGPWTVALVTARATDGAASGGKDTRPDGS